MWVKDIERTNAKRGQGMNKLRFYRLFKQTYGAEGYVKALPFTERRSLAKIRCGVAPIRIETGRYENSKYLPEDQRVCQIQYVI